VVAIKALACELPAKTDTPLARWQCPDLARAAVESGIVASISGTTIWRWLSSDAIKPWQHRSWIFPRDPDFAAKAARVLDLYGRRFDDLALVDACRRLASPRRVGVRGRMRDVCRCWARNGRDISDRHEIKGVEATPSPRVHDGVRVFCGGRQDSTSKLVSSQRSVLGGASTVFAELQDNSDRRVALCWWWITARLRRGRRSWTITMSSRAPGKWCRC
jgi:hypothetical protein